MDQRLLTLRRGGSPLLTGLSAFWKMEEASGARADASGDGLNLTANNNPVGVAGKIGNACQLVKASNQFLSHIDDPKLHLASVSHSVVGWFNVASLGAVSVFWSKDNNGSGGNDRSASLAFYSANLHYNLFDNANNVVLDAIAPGGQIGLAAWLFIAVRYDAVAGTGNIRVGNTLNSNATKTGTPFSTASPFRVGADNGGSARNFDGAVDALGIWQRVLSDAELDLLYNSGAGKEWPF